MQRERVYVYFTPEVIKKLKSQAKKSGLSVSGLINLTVSMWLARK